MIPKYTVCGPHEERTSNKRLDATSESALRLATKLPSCNASRPFIVRRLDHFRQDSFPTGSVAFGGLETRAPLTEAQIDGIARELVTQLTLEEKIGMMSGNTNHARRTDG